MSTGLCIACRETAARPNSELCDACEDDYGPVFDGRTNLAPYQPRRSSLPWCSMCWAHHPPGEACRWGGMREALLDGDEAA